MKHMKIFFNQEKKFLKWFSKISHTTFIIIVGIASSISYFKWKNRNRLNEFYKRSIIRGISLIIYGGIISGLTYYMFPYEWVRYGILSFIGSAVISTSVVVGNYKLVGKISMVILTFLLYLKNNIFFLDNFCNSNALFCFISGIKNVSYNALDHFGYIPNIIYVLLGILFGYSLYRNNTRQYPINVLNNYDDNLKTNRLAQITSWIGRHSLEIYFIHWFVFFIIIKFFATIGI